MKLFLVRATLPQRAAKLRLIRSPASRRPLSSAPAAASAAPEAPKQSASMAPRIIGFSIFSVALGFGALAYSLTTDEATLFIVRDRFPGLVNAIAPILGLPQEAVRDIPTEEEEYQPTDIKEIVGESVFVAAKMASGQVVVLECNAHETPEGINKLALVGRPGDRVLDVAVLEKEKAVEMQKKDPVELGKEMNAIHIPDIPETVTMHTLQVALELCRQMEADMTVRLQLTRNENDIRVLTRGLEELEKRKQELKELIKKENKKMGLRSLFRRGY